MIAVDLKTGKTIEPGTLVTDSRGEPYVYGAPTDVTVPGKSGKVRLVDANGDNTYLYAHIVGLAIEPDEGYLAWRDKDSRHAGVVIYGESVTYQWADSFIKGMFVTPVKLVDKRVIGRMQDRVYRAVE